MRCKHVLVGRCGDIVEAHAVWMCRDVAKADPGGSSSESSDILVGLRGMRVPQ